MKTTLTMQAETIEEEQHLKDVLSVYEYKRALNEFLDMLNRKVLVQNDTSTITWEDVKDIFDNLLCERGIIL